MDVSAEGTSKGQVTRPTAVREALGAKPGDGLLSRVVDGHALVARAPELLELAGSIPGPAELRGAPWGRSWRGCGARGERLG